MMGFLSRETDQDHSTEQNDTASTQQELRRAERVICPTESEICQPHSVQRTQKTQSAQLLEQQMMTTQ